MNKQREKAIKILKAGGVIGFPTETIYGIGACLNQPQAIGRIFKIKKRPRSKPLPILISNLNQLSQLVSSVPVKAKKLIKENWPGPLTIVLYKSKKVPKLVTGGGSKVGIRMPNHPIALELIKKCGPIVATSANISGKPPALTAKEVKDNLPEIDYVINGGKVKLGKASRVIDLTEKYPKILRS